MCCVAPGVGGEKDVINYIIITKLILLVLLISEAGKAIYNEETDCFFKI